jgi:hypothetical protein
MTPRHRSHGRHSNPGAGRRCRSRTLDKESIRSAGIWWVTLGISVFTMTTAAAPALALVRPKALTCLIGTHSAEVAPEGLSEGPANGATVQAGTPVVLSVESLQHHAPRFSVASSPTLLYRPDIDSGRGSQLGAFYTFVSAKATATPRTIYWIASFTFTVDGCKRPATFTTPVRVLRVVP